MDKLTLKQVETAVETMASLAVKNEAYYSQLDGVMGDGDFGASLAGGFKAVQKGFASLDRSSISSFLLGVASTVMSNTGGCSGPVWGTLFMRCGAVAKGKESLKVHDIVAMLKSAMEGISARGGASVGDKTVLDALNDIVLSLEASIRENCSLLDAMWRAGAEAKNTRERTRGWVAKRGRQSFTGDRSAGTYDPGIVAIGDMAAAIAAALKEGGTQ